MTDIASIVETRFLRFCAMLLLLLSDFSPCSSRLKPLIVANRFFKFLKNMLVFEVNCFRYTCEFICSRVFWCYRCCFLMSKRLYESLELHLRCLSAWPICILWTQKSFCFRSFDLESNPLMEKFHWWVQFFSDIFVTLGFDASELLIFLQLERLYDIKHVSFCFFWFCLIIFDVKNVIFNVSIKDIASIVKNSFFENLSNVVIPIDWFYFVLLLTF